MKYDQYGKDPKITAFLDELIALYKKHDMTLSHEDGHGAFIVEGYDEHNVQWVLAASDGRGEPA